MPRRRMIDPFFYTDAKVGKLSRDERSLIVGCVCQADDEGRLQGDPAFLKSQIFKYDKDLDDTTVQKLRDICLGKMKSWSATHPYRMALYSSSDEEYICFPNWAATNRPSHATKSQLPAPPPEALPLFSGKPQETSATPSSKAPETVTKSSGEPPPQSSLGQSSQGKVSIGKVREVQEDFTKFSDNETDLTDFLMKTMTQYISAGRARLLETGSYGTNLPPEKETFNKQQMAMLVLEQFWKQATGMKLSGTLWQGAFAALGKHPIEVMTRVFVKAARYHGGKHQSWKYFQTIIDEELAKSRSP